jgi:hypothetical protein
MLFLSWGEMNRAQMKRGSDTRNLSGELYDVPTR